MCFVEQHLEQRDRQLGVPGAQLGLNPGPASATVPQDIPLQAGEED